MSPIRQAWRRLDVEARAIIIATPFAIPIVWWMTFTVIPAVEGLALRHEVQTPCPSFCDRCRAG